MNIAPSKIGALRRTVYRFFERGRRDLPWRRRVTPYRVFVSEVMLQQTQVPRVELIFPSFVRRFPSWKRLANAPLKDILAAWQGLGYNRRATWLHESARAVVNGYGGRLPRDVRLLAALPGVGPATAASVAVYAFDEPAVFIETNIRAVFIHRFFKGRDTVSDGEIIPLVEATLDRENPSRWYSALMDYGASLKKTHNNPARRSGNYKRQSRFEGSARQARGAVLRALIHAKRGKTLTRIEKETGMDAGRVRRAVDAFVKEGLIQRRGRTLSIKS